MKKKNLVWAAVCCALFLSCTNMNKPEGVQTIDVSTQIDNPKETPLRQFAESVEFVQLETSDTLLMKDIYYFNMLDDYFLIDGRLFDRQGKFIRTVYHSGQGPEEVASPMKVLVRNNQVHVLDRDGSIKVFSLDGKLTGKLKAPAITYFDLLPLDDGQYVGFKSNFKGDEKTCLEFFSQEGIQGSVPYTVTVQPVASWFFPGEGKFFETGDELFLKKKVCDTLYRIDTKQYAMTPAYRIDYGRWASDESIRYSFNSIEEIQQNMFMKVPFVTFLGASKGNIVFTQIIADLDKRQMTNSTTLYNRSTGEANCVILKFAEEDFKSWGKSPDEKTGNDIGFSYTDFAPRFMSEDGQFMIACRVRDDLQEELNPVLAIAKLK